MAEVQLPTSQLEIDDQNIGMEVDDEVALEINDKIEILKGFESDLSAATYCLHNEDHTLGNALRYMLMKK
jgi:RNA polymerase Rpb3/Rpb11 dimerisation domain